jgi:hypothetical protein
MYMIKKLLHLSSSTSTTIIIHINYIHHSLQLSIPPMSQSPLQYRLVIKLQPVSSLSVFHALDCLLAHFSVHSF